MKRFLKGSWWENCLKRFSGLVVVIVCLVEPLKVCSFSCSRRELSSHRARPASAHEIDRPALPHTLHKITQVVSEIKLGLFLSVLIDNSVSEPMSGSLSENAEINTVASLHFTRTRTYSATLTESTPDTGHALSTIVWSVYSALDRLRVLGKHLTFAVFLSHYHAIYISLSGDVTMPRFLFWSCRNVACQRLVIPAWLFLEALKWKDTKEK